MGSWANDWAGEINSVLINKHSMGNTCFRLHVIIVGCIALIVSACSRDGTEPVAVEPDEPELPHEVHWRYEGHEGPEHWADISENFAACRNGAHQSPIGLTAAVPIEDVGLERRLGDSVTLC